MSAHLFQQAQQYIPGGVNSPVRAFKSVGGEPVFIDRASGAYIYDTDGKAYVDYVGSWGPMVLGHAHPEVIQAVVETAAKGLSFGAPTELEIQMAKKITELLPSIEKVRMVSSGTEATMSAIRLARGFTGRDTILKFEGCYHGHSDSLLVNAGSGALTFGVPSSPGVPKTLAEQTLTLAYNDSEALETLFAQRGDELACVIVEPIPGNMGCILPKAGYLQTLRRLCSEHSCLLIFDEVMSGFRVALGGAQGLFDVKPDLTTLGKVIGGGMPVGAFGGRAEIMDHLAPDGPVYQAGTLSGNPVAMAAGLKTLDLVSEPGFFDALHRKTESFVQALSALAREAEIPLSYNQVGGMFGLFFNPRETVSSFADVTQGDVDRFNRFFHGMLDRGVYLAPSAYEAGFVSAAHDEEAITFTLDAAEATLKQL